MYLEDVTSISNCLLSSCSDTSVPGMRPGVSRMTLLNAIKSSRFKSGLETSL